MNWLKRNISIFNWGSRYQRSDLQGDINAGLTVAVMLVPQAMAYALLAGLPPVMGLHASTIPLVIYGLLGSSRQLAVGPVAVVSMLVAAGVGELAEGGSAHYFALAILLALMVGIIQLLFGLVRLGVIVKLLSHPVISGFTSAAALIIGASQLGSFMGVTVTRSHSLLEVLLAAFGQLTNVSVPTLAIGGLSMAALVVARRRWPHLPMALIVVGVSTLGVWGLGLHDAGVKIIGYVPAGLPQPSIPSFFLSDVAALLPTAMIISVVGYMESIAVAKAVAARHDHSIDANLELTGLGLANIAGSLFGAYPVTGGFSRTVVNDQAGANTPLASLITAAAISVSLLFLTPLFHYLPVTVLASIIMVSVASLVKPGDFLTLAKTNKLDAALLALTFGATISLGIKQGLLSGIGTSLLISGWRVLLTWYQELHSEQ